MHLNVMFDPRPMYPQMHHPMLQHRSRDFKGNAPHSSRTRHPVKYYLIDFGLSRKYDADNSSPRELPIWGGDKTVPEFQNNMDQPHNPFFTDIYYLGSMFRESLLEVSPVTTPRHTA